MTTMYTVCQRVIIEKNKYRKSTACKKNSFHTHFFPDKSNNSVLTNTFLLSKVGLQKSSPPPSLIPSPHFFEKLILSFVEECERGRGG